MNSYDWSKSQITNSRWVSFQKYIRCRIIEDQSRNVELFEVTHVIGSYTILS